MILHKEYLVGPDVDPHCEKNVKMYLKYSQLFRKNNQGEQCHASSILT